MAKKKAKENLEIPGKVVKEYREKRPGAIWGKDGEVWCTIRIIEGRLPSGTYYQSETIMPDKTPEEQAKWEEDIKEGCREFVRGYIRKNGYEAARKRLAVE